MEEIQFYIQHGLDIETLHDRLFETFNQLHSQNKKGRDALASSPSLLKAKRVS